MSKATPGPEDPTTKDVISPEAEIDAISQKAEEDIDRVVGRSEGTDTSTASPEDPTQEITDPEPAPVTAPDAVVDVPAPGAEVPLPVGVDASTLAPADEASLCPVCGQEMGTNVVHNVDRYGRTVVLHSTHYVSAPIPEDLSGAHAEPAPAVEEDPAV